MPTLFPVCLLNWSSNGLEAGVTFRMSSAKVGPSKRATYLRASTLAAGVRAFPGGLPLLLVLLLLLLLRMP